MANVIKQLRLINVDPETNMNRFWEGRLYDNDDFESVWGRVGVGNPQSKMFPGGGLSKFEQMRKDKAKKGYSELKTIASGNSAVMPVQSKDVNRQELREIARAQIIKSSSPQLDRLIDRLVQANVHRITSNTQIKFNSSTGLFSTPLGIVTPDGIREARNLLVTISQGVDNRNFQSISIKNAFNQYMRIVPQNVGMRRFDIDTIFPDSVAVQKQSDVLDSLEASYQALSQNSATTSNQATKQLESIFQVDLDILSHGSEYDRLNRWFENSKKSMHRKAFPYTVKQIYTVNIHSMTNAFETKSFPIREVWHGTSQANVLSILKTGLRTAPPSTAAVAGKMFGNGIYGANVSTKSLNYSIGGWGQGGVGDAAWLFVCQFAMGRIQTVTKEKRDGVDRGYDSIYAKGGYDLFNDEFIVFRNSQVKITHLLECH